ncbi:MAG: zinc-dependent metalloprotease [Saprospiraceae bacterium]|nr:zinc-dependent metalloprotease [Saprospiraceae bacterium]
MKNILTASLLLLAISSFAQTIPFHHRCAYDHAVEARETDYPGYKAQVNAIFEAARRMADEEGGLRATYTIPVAVHVVWKENEEHLTEERVLEQLAILNEDYQRMNPDTALMRSIFDTIVANPSIEFRLDSIIWVKTTSTFGGGGLFPDINAFDEVKASATGGSDALDPTSYLNIWMTNLGAGGVLGYAYPPDGLSNWPTGSAAPTQAEEGVVIDSRVVGRQGSYNVSGQSLTTQGRTGTHEVGHYLGLRHIWGDGLLSQLGIPDCNADDGLNDTPNAGLPSQFACDTTQNTCDAGQAGDLPDMIENFMDYSDESCQNSFTNGQVGIMQAVLTAERANLANTMPMNTAARPANDMRINAVALQVNTDGTCTNVASSTNLNASASWSTCAGTGFANDVWFSFTATGASINVTFLNVVANNGTATDLNFEVVEGDSQALTSLGCGDASTSTISGLTAGNTYYIRVYSNDADAGNSHNFDICLQEGTISSSYEHTLAENSLNIYPNPSRGIVNVEINTSVEFAGNIVVRNLLGQCITEKLNIDHYSQNLQIDLSAQPLGIYVIEFSVNGQKMVKKIALAK